MKNYNEKQSLKNFSSCKDNVSDTDLQKKVGNGNKCRKDKARKIIQYHASISESGRTLLKGTGSPPREIWSSRRKLRPVLP